MNELCTKGAGELAGLIASGKVTSAEVVDAYLARIAEVNPALNAVTVTLADEARAAAAAVDRAFSAAVAELGRYTSEETHGPRTDNSRGHEARCRHSASQRGFT